MIALKDLFALYFHGLKAAVAPTLSMPKERFAFVAAVWHYIFRLSGRLDRLITRWKNGTLPKPRAPQPRAHQPPAPQPLVPQPDLTPDTPRAKPAFRLPGGHMWLIRGIQGTAFAGSQLAHLIATNAELHEFLEAAPQGRRLLNPLCRALGVDFDKPTGVALPKPTAEPKPEPEPASSPPPVPSVPAPSVPVQTHPLAAATPPNPPVVF